MTNDVMKTQATLPANYVEEADALEDLAPEGARPHALDPPLGVHLAVANTIAGLFVELVETDFFPLGSRRIKGDGTRDQRQLEVAFPIRTRGHDILHTNELRRICGGYHFPRTGVEPQFVVGLLICSDRNTIDHSAAELTA